MKTATTFALAILGMWLQADANAQGDENFQARLARALEKFPDADLNKDGTLTRAEFEAFRNSSRKPNRPSTSDDSDDQVTINALAKSTPRFSASALAERFDAREFEGVLYRFFAPEIKEINEQKYPLVLSLHGAGGKGSDNLANLKNWNGTMTEPDFQKSHPCFIVAPQSAGAWRVPADDPPLSSADISAYPEVWQKIAKTRAAWLERSPEGNLAHVFALLDSIAENYPIDPDRVYVLGHSMGGFGSFEAIAQQPDRFAAAIPSAGGLLPWHDISSISHVPIWAFHGEADPTVPYGLSQVVFDQLKTAGGNMKLTRLGGVGHGSAAFAFIYPGDNLHKNFETLLCGDLCDSTEDVWNWLFAQRRQPK